jgi:hypothetical protein
MIPISASGVFSCGAWINPSATTSIETIVDLQGPISQSCRIILNSDRPGGVEILFKDSGGTPYIVTETGYAWPTNTWINLMGTWDGSVEKLYINGSLNNSSLFGGQSTGGSSNIILGSASPGYQQYKGLMDDVRIYNRALSASEIAAMYAGGK